MPASLYFGGKLIEGITAGLTEALPFMSSLVEAGLGANETLKTLAEAGFAFRRQTALSVFRQLSDVASVSTYIKAVPNKFLPDIRKIPHATTTIRRNFSYRVRIDGRNVDTGEKNTRYLTVTTDTLLPKNQVYDIADGIIGEQLMAYDTEVTGFTVDQIVKSPAVQV